MTETNHENVPGEEHWEEYTRNQDTSYTYNHYSGKTTEQILFRFEDFPMGAVEDLYYMPAIPFQYYISAPLKLLKNSDDYGTHLEELATSFLALVLFKLRDEPLHILPILNDVMPIVESVAFNQARFAEESHNNGSYLKTLEKIRTAISNL